MTPAPVVAGVFFTLTVVPALLTLVGAFLGRRAALGLGAFAALLTIGMGMGTPPSITLQESQWQVTLAGQDAVARATLLAPRDTVAARVMGDDGSAVLYVCIRRGTTSEVEVRLGGVSLQPVATPVASECWKQYAVPAGTIAGGQSVLEASVSARPGGTVDLVGGYTRPHDTGGPSGGSALVLGALTLQDDLSPTAPGIQVGRYFVEMRVFNRAGRIVEIWY